MCDIFRGWALAPRRRLLWTAVALVIVVLALVGASVLSARRNSSAVSATPRILASENVGQRLRDLTIASPALAANVKVRVMLPPGYEEKPTLRWPALYLLHGCCEDYRSWTRYGRITSIRALNEVLVVMPEGGRAGLYSNWLNHGDRGPPRWETFHTRELPHLLESELRAEQPFAIAGLSMGGLGAINYAARHPDMFSAAASYSGILNPRSDTDIVFGLLRSEDVDPLAPWGDPVRDASIWRTHDPIELAPRLRPTALFVSAGNGDPGPLDPPGAGFDELEAALRTQAEAFVSHLRGLGIAPHADFYDRGTHTWPYWRRELRRSLPLLLRNAAASTS